MVKQVKLRLREHKSTAPSANSPVSAHTKSGHNINWEGVKVLEKGNRSDTRKIREAIHIKTLILEILLETLDLSSSQRLPTDEETIWSCNYLGFNFLGDCS